MASSTFANLLARDHDRSTLLRWTFVGMLFALALEGVANKLIAWLQSDMQACVKIAAGTHTALALIVVTASWVGWSRSFAPGNHRPLKRVFSLEFVVLLIDLALVIVYFAIAENIESPPESSETADKASAAFAIRASAQPECVGVACMFILYLIWDIVADCCMDWRSEHWIQDESGSPPKRRRINVNRCAVSLICFILVLPLVVAHWLEPFPRPESVIAADLSLLGLAVLFRALKTIEGLRAERLDLIRRSPVRALDESDRHVKATQMPLSACQHGWLYGSLVLYGFAGVISIICLDTCSLTTTLSMIFISTSGVVVLAGARHQLLMHVKDITYHKVSRELRSERSGDDVIRAVRELGQRLPGVAELDRACREGPVRDWKQVCEELANGLSLSTADMSAHAKGSTEMRVSGNPPLRWRLQVLTNGAATIIRLEETGFIADIKERGRDRFCRRHTCRVDLFLKALARELGEDPAIE